MEGNTLHIRGTITHFPFLGGEVFSSSSGALEAFYWTTGMFSRCAVCRVKEGRTARERE